MKKLIKILIKFLFWIIILLILVIIFVVVYDKSKTPLLNRNWEEESKILPDITISTPTVEIENIRDWRYKNKEVISKNYYSDIFEIDKLSKAYLLFNPFGQWAGVGHSFFVFEFSDGKEISFSIEARKEEGEIYSALKGVFNQFEIWYAVGSSADFLTRRAIYHNEDLYLYPLLISNKSAKTLFVDMASATEKLETTPGFYNTVTSNCTNLLADSANRVKKGSIPFHYSRLFTGYADDQLYDLGYIPHDKPFEQIYNKSRIDDKIKKLFQDKENYSREEFWQILKQELNV